eukprot:UN00384
MHGHQIVPWGDQESIAAKTRQLDVDIMITAHTHTLSISTINNQCLINPGSLTGAYSPHKANNTPSFVCLRLQEINVRYR